MVWVISRVHCVANGLQKIIYNIAAISGHLIYAHDMSPDEDKVWRSIQQKDAKVFEQFYREHYKMFLISACKYMGDMAVARDMVNDVFVKVWEEAGRITIQTSPRSYLYRAVINRCLNELDKQKRERLYKQEIVPRGEEGADWKAMEYNELKVRLYKAIDHLPEQAQRVFKMSRFEQLKQQEIADALGISVKTVKNHITYALQRLSKVMEEWNRLPVLFPVLKFLFEKYRDHL